MTVHNEVYGRAMAALDVYISKLVVHPGDLIVVKIRGLNYGLSGDPHVMDDFKRNLEREFSAPVVLMDMEDTDLFVVGPPLADRLRGFGPPESSTDGETIYDDFSGEQEWVKE
jgi:hypothetical protein